VAVRWRCGGGGGAVAVRRAMAAHGDSIAYSDIARRVSVASVLLAT
jgi:hypothetical protein